MVYFQTKNPYLGKFLGVLLWKMLVCFIDTWSIVRPFGIFYGQLVYFVATWCIFSRFVCCTDTNLASLEKGWRKCSTPFWLSFVLSERDVTEVE
jgi:hypothetical protein